jgi:hypothetical protein
LYRYYTGVWVRLNGGMDGNGDVVPNLVGLPLTTSKVRLFTAVECSCGWT